MRKLEAYHLNWKEKQFIRILEANGFYYDKLSNQISSKDRSLETPFLGHITEDKHCGFSGYLIIYDEFEKRDEAYLNVKETFSKLRKLAQDFS